MAASRNTEAMHAWEARIETALRAGDFEAAIAAADCACAQALVPQERAIALYWRARCDYVVSRHESALAAALEVIGQAEALGEVELEANGHALISRILRAVGDSQHALEHALKAIELVGAATGESPDRLRSTVSAHNALGVVYLSLQEYDLALDAFQRAIEFARRLPDAVELGAGLDCLACTQASIAGRERARGQVALSEQWERAGIANLTESLRIAREHGHRGNEFSALNNLSEALCKVGEAPQASELLDQWAQRYRDALPRQRAHYLDTRGVLSLTMGRPEEARTWFEEALRQTDSPVFRLVVLEHLSQAIERCGDWQAALERYKEFHALHVAVSSERSQLSARIAAVTLQVRQTRAQAETLMRSNEQLQRRAQDLQRLSAEDPLTGLANRRRLDELLAAGFRQTSVALIDVDHFKQVNDAHSHAVGDAVLRVLAGLLRDGCRQRDTACRLGGEEFVVLLDATAQDAAEAAAERVRVTVEAHDWSRLAAGLAVTVSLGVAHGHEADSPEQLLALADQRLYRAKRSGRNRTVGKG